MLSKISGFLFVATVNDCFLLFFYNNDTQCDKGSVSKATKTGTLNICTLTLFSAKYVFKIIVLKQAIKNSSSVVALYSQRRKILRLSVAYTTHLQYCKICFFFSYL